MSDKGISFSAPMVRALVAGQKTQTRRLLNPVPPSWVYPNDLPGFSCLTPKGHIEFRGRYVDADGVDHGPASKFIKLPFLKGDRLYVRESYFQFGHWEPVEGKLTKGGRQKWGFVGVPSLVQFEEPAEGFALARHRDHPMVTCWHKRLGRFMPRALSRMWLEVTDVRVQRLHDISEADAQAEGVERLVTDGLAFYAGFPEGTYRCGFAGIWQYLHTADGERWDDNPWVVAVSFDVHRGNIDQVQA